LSCSSGILQAGVKRIVNQVVTPRIETEIKPKVSQAVCEVLGLNADDLNSQDESRDDGEGQSFIAPLSARGGKIQSLGWFLLQEKVSLESDQFSWPRGLLWI